MFFSAVKTVEELLKRCFFFEVKIMSYYYIRKVANQFYYTLCADEECFVDEFNWQEDLNCSTYDECVDAMLDLPDWSEVSNNLQYIAELFNERLNRYTASEYDDEEDRRVEFNSEKSEFMSEFCETNEESKLVDKILQFDPNFEL